MFYFFAILNMLVYITIGANSVFMNFEFLYALDQNAWYDLTPLEKYAHFVWIGKKIECVT